MKGIGNPETAKRNDRVKFRSAFSKIVILLGAIFLILKLLCPVKEVIVVERGLRILLPRSVWEKYEDNERGRVQPSINLIATSLQCFAIIIATGVIYWVIKPKNRINTVREIWVWNERGENDEK